MCGIAASLCLAVANYLCSDLSMRIGIPAVYATWPAFIITWAAYHIYLWIKHCRSTNEQDEQES